LAVLRGRDPQRALELAETALGWLDGITVPDRWPAPASLVARAPAAIREGLEAREATGLPIARRGDLHAVYACGADLVLHVRTGDRERCARASAVQRALGGLAGVPAVQAVADDGVAHWVLEERLDIRPLPRDPTAWWPLACRWFAELGRRPAPGDGGWCERTASEFPQVADALRRAAELPAGPAHGQPGPDTLFRHAGDGIAVLGWEAAELDAPLGVDLVALATRIQRDEDRLAMLSGLLDGQEPRTGPLLGPLAGLGVPRDALPALVAAALAQLAGGEAVRAAALGMPPAPLVYRPLLERLAPRLTGDRP
jgi:hypothetical protein